MRKKPHPLASCQLGAPPNTGDWYLVELQSGHQVIIAFDIQQGWINSAWEKFNESDMKRHCYYGEAHHE